MFIEKKKSLTDTSVIESKEKRESYRYEFKDGEGFYITFKNKNTLALDISAGGMSFKNNEFEQFDFDFLKLTLDIPNFYGDNTFFGAQSSYDVSVASGRLTYFGNDELSNEIGKIYSHHYYRIHYNGELLDETYSRVVPRLVTGPSINHPLVQKKNLILIRSHNYLAELQLISEIQDIYILRCKWGIDQIKKVIVMLNQAISK